MPPTTMVACFEGDRSGDSILEHVMRGEWYLPDPGTPACGLVRYVRPEETNDGTERLFVCDLAAGHAEPRHRQVTDVAEGEAITWNADDLD